MKKLSFLALALALAAGLAFAFLNRPGAGYTYHFGDTGAGFNQNPAVLIKHGRCLSLTQDEAAIESRAAQAEEGLEIFPIALVPPVTVREISGNLALHDPRNDVTVQPGEGFLGISSFRGEKFYQNEGSSPSWNVRWPIEKECGEGLAIVASIDRVLTTERPDE